MNVQVSTRIPKDVRDEAAAVLSHYGLDLPTAFKMFAVTIANERRVPIKIDQPVLRLGNRRTAIDLSGLDIIGIDPKHGHALLPAELDCAEDQVYEQLL
ncbi:MAG: type II toxin-antitoxin system RelB/DinJ family antitoxin [Coriobacteriales bacterium]|nr:type II toxin-antitoxin system RelB/DinJ family antitoxin [Coriobacteriales bacterium]